MWGAAILDFDKIFKENAKNWQISGPILYMIDSIHDDCNLHHSKHDYRPTAAFSSYHIVAAIYILVVIYAI